MLLLTTVFSALVALTIASPELVVVTTVVTADAPAQPTSPSYTNPSTLRSSILNSTNTYRALYNATALTWNTTLASYAHSYAQACNFKHSGGPYGENLAAGYGNATSSVEGWGDEAKDYDFSKGDFGEATGHFTQLVWKATTSTGCGVADCQGENGTPGWYLVCEYWPQGNVIGEFLQEVQGKIKPKHEGNLPDSSAGKRSAWGGAVGVAALGIALLLV